MILDVDTGIDDAIAIMLALASKEVELLGITTVSGNVHVDKATVNTRRVLKFLNRADIKVYKGSNSPLSRKLVDATQVHGTSGLAGQLENIDVSEINNDIDAISFLEESILKYGDELTIIMTGPQTNLAKLFIMKPHLSKQLKKVIAMGGAISVKGNHSPVAEFNILTDPEAVYNVMHEGISDMTLISLDVTLKALLYREDLNLIRNSKIKEFIFNLTEQYMNRYFIKNGVYACPMHDPLTIIYLLNEKVLDTELKYVTVEKKSEYSDGMTICDFDNHWGKEANVKISNNIDYTQFKNDFFELLNHL